MVNCGGVTAQRHELKPGFVFVKRGYFSFPFQTFQMFNVLLFKKSF